MPGRSRLQSTSAPPMSSDPTAHQSSISRNDFSDEQSSLLRSRLGALFSEAQFNLASHRKLVVSMRKIQEACMLENKPIAKRPADAPRYTTDDFNDVFLGLVLHILCVKKSESVGDKIVRFVSQFLKHGSECDFAALDEDALKDPATITETPCARLGNQILAALIQRLVAKDKTVRYRATQIVAHILNSLDAIDDDHYILLRVALLKRIRDKEAMVRVQAVMGLIRLAGSDDEYQENVDSDDESTDGLTVKLVELLQNDPSSDVRRALLLNLPLTPVTLPYLLERARDEDFSIRRALYSRLLPALADFRHLSLSMREKLLRWGLRDRDENVRKATADLFRRRWIDDCAQTSKDSDHSNILNQQKQQPPSLDALLELLERIDIVNSGVDEGIGKQAMQEFWDGRQDYREQITFEESFWAELTPESVFVARTWNDFSISSAQSSYLDLGDGKIPEVTRLAFCLEHNILALTKVLRQNANDEAEPEETIELEFVVEQLLHIAKSLDYSDEIGRRKMSSLMRESLAIAELPEEITQLVIEVLRDVCGSDVADERDFCGIILEIIAEIHDNLSVTGGNDEIDHDSFHSARSEISDRTPTDFKAVRRGNDEPGQDDEQRAVREIMINMKCLHIAQCMLQNVEGALQTNMHIMNMLNNLIVPAIRSQEAPVRERGLLCLGLCCLLDANLAAENLSLFVHCFSKGHDLLQITALQTVSDILECHPSLFLSPDVDPALPKMILRMFSKAIKAGYSPLVQSEAITALCKLLLVGVIDDDDLLQQAVLSFFDSTMTGNEAARQALSYSLPVYCYSKRENMEKMAHVAKSVLVSIMRINEDSSDKEDTIAINKVGAVLADWTDARKLVVADEGAGFWTEVAINESLLINGDAHLILAEHLLEQSLHHSCSKEDRKALFAVLGKLHVLTGSSEDRLSSVQSVSLQAMENRIANDASSKTALSKLHAATSKVLSDRKSVPGGSLPDTAKGLHAEIEVEEAPAMDQTAAVERDDSILDELLDDEDGEEDESSE